MKVVITGGAGFLGKKLARRILQQGTLAGPDGNGRRLEWAYPGTLSLQMIALYRRGGGGLYAAADDTLAYRKTFVLWGERDVHTRCTWSPRSRRSCRPRPRPRRGRSPRPSRTSP